MLNFARRWWLVGTLAGAVLLAADLVRAGAVTQRGPDVHGASALSHILTHGESVPDFAEHHTVASVKSGAWSEASTWDAGRVPKDGDIVRVEERTTVVYDMVSDARLRAVGVAGTLTFRPTADTRLRVTHLLVYSGGTLTIGDKARPIQASARAEIVINDEPLGTGTEREPGIDPFQYGNGVLVWGTLSLSGAGRTPAFARLATEAAKGDRALLLAETPAGWRAGDTMLLPDSRLIADDQIEQVDRSPYNLEGSRGLVRDPQWETAEIARIDGARVVLAAPLSHDHPGARSASGAVKRKADGTPMLPHVANLSRNVVVRSDNPNGVRGHVICFHDASVSIVNALFQGLGRTTAAPLDNTRTDETGRVVHIGTNVPGRYPVHMHHLVDPMHVGAAGSTFLIAGNVVDNAPRWGIVIHGSHYGMINDNVVMDVDGAGIVTEDGSETGNRFEHNFVAAVRGSGQPLDARPSADGMGHEGAGFWFGSDNNVVINNVAAGVRDGGFTLFRTPEALPFPVFPGRSPAGDDEPARVFEFSGNEAYGAAETGVELWDSKGCEICRTTEVVLRDTTVWHSRNGVKYDYHADAYRLDGLVVSGDPGQLAGTAGVLANYSRRAALTHADIEDVDVGIDGGGSRNRDLEIDRVSVRARVGVRIRRGISSGAPESARFRDLSVTALPGGGGKLVELDPGPYGRGTVKLTERRPIYFFNFQNRGGTNFQLFFPDQAPDHRIPQDPEPTLGCPEPGLTNAACFKAHNIAIGGEVATCDRTIGGVDGFACPVPSGTPINP